MKETPTRELIAPRTQIGENEFVEHVDGHYKTVEETQEDLWAIMHGEPETDAPCTLLEKHQYPFKRNI